MFYLITYDKAGAIVGMHGSSIKGELSDLVSDTDFDGALIVESDSVPTIQNKVIRDGRLVDRERNINDIRRDGIRRLNRLTSAQRTPYITKVRGQGLLHMKKHMEAKEYLALPNIPNDLSDFPLLEAEIVVSGGSAVELARLWIDKARETDAALARIERAKMEAKAAIQRADSEEEVDLVLKHFEGNNVSIPDKTKN